MPVQSKPIISQLISSSFPDLKNIRKFDWLRNLGEGICDTSQISGELGDLGSQGAPKVV